MASRSTSSLRTARASSVTLAVVIVSWLAHVLAGGSATVSPVMLVLAAACFWGSWALSGRRLSFLKIASLLAVGQVGLHIALTTTAMPAHAAGHSAAHSAAPSGVMILSHAVATVGLAVAIATADKSISSVEQWISALCAPLSREARVPILARPPLLETPLVVAFRNRIADSPQSRRGPPSRAGSIS